MNRLISAMMRRKFYVIEYIEDCTGREVKRHGPYTRSQAWDVVNSVEHCTDGYCIVTDVRS